MLVDTAEPDRPLPVRVRPPGEQYPLFGRSIALLRTVRKEEAELPLTSTQLEVLRREAVRATQGPAVETPLR
jgi:hypothetical protein